MPWYTYWETMLLSNSSASYRNVVWDLGSVCIYLPDQFSNVIVGSWPFEIQYDNVQLKYIKQLWAFPNNNSLYFINAKSKTLSLTIARTMLYTYFILSCTATHQRITPWRARWNFPHLVYDISKCIFRNKMHQFRLRFYWNMFLRFELSICHYCFK